MPSKFEEFLAKTYGQGGTASSGGYGQGLGVAAPATSGTPDNPNVFLGRRERTAPGAAGAAGVGRTGYGNTGYAIQGDGPKYDEVQDFNTASSSIYSWPPQEQQQLAKRLYNAGMLEDPSDLKALSSIWADAVYQAGMQYTASEGRTRVTPLQYLNARIDLAVSNGEARVPKTTTSTNTNVFLPDKSDAKAAVSTLFQEAMGRDPEDDEMDRYVSMMMSSYKKNPSKTTTTTTTNPNGNSTSNTRTTGQYNPAQDLEDRVEADPEWGAYQAATTYFNALQQALGAPADLV